MERINGDGNKKLKTAKELAIEGNIAWDKEANESEKEGEEKIKVEEAKKEPVSKGEKTPLSGGKIEMVFDEEEGKGESGEEEGKEEKKGEGVEKNEPEKEISKEKLSLLKAAEVLCLIDLKNANPSEYEEAISKLENEFSKEVIEKAIKVTEMRERGIAAYLSALNEQKRLKSQKTEMSLVEICKQNQKAGNLEYKFFERKNFYDPAIMALKEELLNEKEKKLWEEIEKDPILSKLSFEEKEKDIKRKLLEYEADYLWKLVTTEKARDAEIKNLLHMRSKLESAGVIQKTLIAFSRLPRGVRAMIGAAVVGGSFAYFGAPVGAGLLFLKIARAGVGGTVAAALQKIWGNKFVENVYKKKSKKSFDLMSKIIRGEEKLKPGAKTEGAITELIYNIFGKTGAARKWLQKLGYTLTGKKGKLEELKASEKEMLALEEDLEKELASLKELIKVGDYQKVAEINLKIAELQLRKMEKHKTMRTFNYFATSFINGILGGSLAGSFVDHLAGVGNEEVVRQSLEKLQPKSLPPYPGAYEVHLPGNLEGVKGVDFHPPTDGGDGVSVEELHKMEVKGLPPYPGVYEVHVPGKLSGIGDGENLSRIGEGTGEKLDELLKIAEIRKGEGITQSFLRQLENDPHKFGYSGNMDPNSVHAWALSEAKRIATEKGYITPEGETRVFNFGEGKNPAYILDVDNSGIKVREVFQGQEGSSNVLNPQYEYEHSYNSDLNQINEGSAPVGVEHLDNLGQKGGPVPPENIPPAENMPTAHSSVGSEVFLAKPGGQFDVGKHSFKFNYDASGNPEGFRSFIYSDKTGNEYFSAKFQENIAEWSKSEGKDFNSAIQDLGDYGKRLDAYINFYEELKKNGFSKEADYVLAETNRILDTVEKTYGKIFDYSKLPDYLKAGRVDVFGRF
jgi:hypothetical protein